MNISFKCGSNATFALWKNSLSDMKSKSSNGMLRMLAVPFQFPNCTTTFFAKSWVSYAWLFTAFNLLSSLLSFKPNLATSHNETKLWVAPPFTRATNFCPPIANLTYIMPLWVSAWIAFRSWKGLTPVGVFNSLWSSLATIRAFNFSLFRQSLALCGSVHIKQPNGLVVYNEFALSTLA